jgi:hypothetical protein
LLAKLRIAACGSLIGQTLDVGHRQGLAQKIAAIASQSLSAGGEMIVRLECLTGDTRRHFVEQRRNKKWLLSDHA